MHVHPGSVDVEVAQRHVVEPAHRVEAAQQALVERLRRAVEGVVAVRMVTLWSRELLRQPVHRGRGGGDDFSHPLAGSGLEHVEGTVDEHLQSKPWLLRALGYPDRRLMEDD